MRFGASVAQYESWSERAQVGAAARACVVRTLHQAYRSTLRRVWSWREALAHGARPARARADRQSVRGGHKDRGGNLQYVAQPREPPERLTIRTNISPLQQRADTHCYHEPMPGCDAMLTELSLIHLCWMNKRVSRCTDQLRTCWRRGVGDQRHLGSSAERAIWRRFEVTVRRWSCR